MSRPVSLDAIQFDAGTQIRAAINEVAVAEYAELMQADTKFPPVVLYHDGNTYYMADGFHRALAAKRIGCTEIPAVVHPGTRADALWFALGANKANGQRLSEADKTHAVAIALRAWPDKMQREIAEQVGCSESLVSKVFLRNTGGEPEIRGRALRDQRKREQVRALVVEGETSVAIAKQLHVTPSIVADVRAEMGMSKSPDRSKAAVAQRRKDIRDMAERGFTSRQIAAAVGIDERTVPTIAKEEGIVIHADRVVARTHRHDANRIVDRMALDAVNLCADVDLIEFASLDAARLAEWLEAFKAAREQLGTFIRRLMKEQQRHGEAA